MKHLAPLSLVLAIIITASANAQTIAVKHVDQVLKETGSDQLNFVCSEDGLVVINDKTVVTNVLKVCLGTDSIEFSCPSSTSVTRRQDRDCDRLSATG